MTLLVQPLIVDVLDSWLLWSATSATQRIVQLDCQCTCLLARVSTRTRVRANTTDGSQTARQQRAARRQLKAVSDKPANRTLVQVRRDRSAEWQRRIRGKAEILPSARERHELEYSQLGIGQLGCVPIARWKLGGGPKFEQSLPCGDLAPERKHDYLRQQTRLERLGRLARPTHHCDRQLYGSELDVGGRQRHQRDHDPVDRSPLDARAPGRREWAADCTRTHEHDPIRRLRID